jgi:SP family arabinose:H+ symporter-like MFS transporter
MVRFLLFASGVTAIGGFLFGYDTAVINGANSYIKEHWRLTPAWEGTATASMLLGCIPGAMFAGFLSDRFGRKRLLFLCAILYAASGVLSALPRTVEEFLAARFLAGLGIGASSMVCPVYIAEIAPEKWRGRLGTLFQLAIVVGIFLTLFVNMLVRAPDNEAWNIAIGWRWMLGLGTVPAVLFLFLLFAVPESPRWLAQHGREEEAGAILRLAGGAEHAQRQMEDIRGSLAEEEGRFSELLTGPFRRPLVIAVVIMACSQFCGINAIIYYSTRIFAAAGAGKEIGTEELKAAAFTSTVWIGLVNLAFTFVAIGLIDRLGRRPLLILGTAVQTAALAMVGWMYHTHQGGFSQQEGFGLLVCVVTFTAAFAMSTGPIGWLLCSEIFPNRVRGRAMSVAAMTVWITDYMVTWSFPKLNDEWVGPAGTFWIYGAASLFALVFVLAAVPETKGRTLEEIEHFWISRAGRGSEIERLGA